MTIEINGMAHVILTVSRFEVAREFCRTLLPEFGMKPVFDGDKLFYCVGARTAIGIEPCDPAPAGERFVQERVGLTTSACVPVRERTWIDALPCSRRCTRRSFVDRRKALAHRATITCCSRTQTGIRLEVNFVPGAGVLADGTQFNPTTGYV
jgi:hypothetical protein